MNEPTKQVFEMAVFQELKKGSRLSEGVLKVGANVLAAGEPDDAGFTS